MSDRQRCDNSAVRDAKYREIIASPRDVFLAEAEFAGPESWANSDGSWITNRATVSKQAVWFIVDPLESAASKHGLPVIANELSRRLPASGLWSLLNRFPLLPYPAVSN
jgi:hypothetical protein